MKSSIKLILAIAVIVPLAAVADDLSMAWGLENTWSYWETQRTIEQDASWKPPSVGKKYRTFAFKDGKTEVNNLRFPCYERHFEFWDKYQDAIAESGDSAAPDRIDFEEFKSKNDAICDQHAKQQAPVLYFDFVGQPNQQYVLEAIDVTTLRFSEYMGGGFFKEEAWYDIVLSHNEGTKRFNVSKRLKFSGSGRCELRFWSDNFYEKQGWISPMGEYMIDIGFVFSDGDKEIVINTGPFKIDV